MRERQRASASFHLRHLIHLLGLVPNSILLVGQRGVSLNKLRSPAPGAIEQIALLESGVELGQSVEVALLHSRHIDDGADGHILHERCRNVPGIVVLREELHDVWGELAHWLRTSNALEEGRNTVWSLVDLPLVHVFGEERDEALLDVFFVVLVKNRPAHREVGHPNIMRQLPVCVLQIRQGHEDVPSLDAADIGHEQSLARDQVLEGVLEHELGRSGVPCVRSEDARRGQTPEVVLVQVDTGILVNGPEHELDNLAEPETVAQNLPLLLRDEFEEPVARGPTQGPVEDRHETLPHLDVRAPETDEERLLHAYRELGSEDLGVFVDANDQVHEFGVHSVVRTGLKEQHLLEHGRLFLQGRYRLGRVEDPCFDLVENLVTQLVVIRALNKRRKNAEVRSPAVDEGANTPGQHVDGLDDQVHNDLRFLCVRHVLRLKPLCCCSLWRKLRAEVVFGQLCLEGLEECLYMRVNVFRLSLRQCPQHIDAGDMVAVVECIAGGSVQESLELFGGTLGIRQFIFWLVKWDDLECAL